MVALNRTLKISFVISLLVLVNCSVDIAPSKEKFDTLSNLYNDFKEKLLDAINEHNKYQSFLDENDKFPDPNEKIFGFTQNKNKEKSVYGNIIDNLRDFMEIFEKHVDKKTTNHGKKIKNSSENPVINLFGSDFDQEGLYNNFLKGAPYRLAEYNYAQFKLYHRNTKKLIGINSSINETFAAFVKLVRALGKLPDEREEDSCSKRWLFKSKK